MALVYAKGEEKHGPSQSAMGRLDKKGKEKGGKKLGIVRPFSIQRA